MMKILACAGALVLGESLSFVPRTLRESAARSFTITQTSKIAARSLQRTVTCGLHLWSLGICSRARNDQTRHSATRSHITAHALYMANVILDYDSTNLKISGDPAG